MDLSVKLNLLSRLYNLEISLYIVKLNLFLLTVDRFMKSDWDSNIFPHNCKRQIRK